MDYKITAEAVEAARALHAEVATSNYLRQVHEIVLQDHDPNTAYEDRRLVHFIPIGDVIGIAITGPKQVVEDKDIVFVSSAALGAAIPALGFRVSKEPGIESPQSDTNQELDSRHAARLYNELIEMVANKAIEQRRPRSRG